MIEVVELAARDVAQARPEIADVYHRAFAGYPYFERDEDVANFALSLDRHAQREGFRCRVARDLPAGTIRGFAYGYTGRPGQWWYEQVAHGLDPGSVERWMTDYFELVNLAVAPGWQGLGLGSKLHDAILAGMPHAVALLSTHDVDTPALRLYHRRGWVPILRGFHFPQSTADWIIMALELDRLVRVP